MASDIKKDPEAMAREIVASRRYVSWMNDSYKNMVNLKAKDGEIARLGKALHSRMGETLWDTLTLVGQADLAITDVRETKLAECPTPGFISTVRIAYCYITYIQIY